MSSRNLISLNDKVSSHQIRDVEIEPIGCLSMLIKSNYYRVNIISLNSMISEREREREREREMGLSL